jgi:hypothetical protein
MLATAAARRRPAAITSRPTNRPREGRPPAAGLRGGSASRRLASSAVADCLSARRARELVGACSQRSRATTNLSAARRVRRAATSWPRGGTPGGRSSRAARCAASRRDIRLAGWAGRPVRADRAGASCTSGACRARASDPLVGPGWSRPSEASSAAAAPIASASAASGENARLGVRAAISAGRGGLAAGARDARGATPRALRSGGRSARPARRPSLPA